MRIRVTEVCPTSRLFRADGEKLREAILERWSADAVEVDFEGETIASVSFLDEAIAVLFLEHPRDLVLSRLKTANMVKGDRDLLNRLVGHRIREAAALTADAPTETPFPR